VIGVGTPHGDDAAGLALAARLEAAGLPEGVRAVSCQRPGVDLPDVLAGADAAVLVDAMRSGRPPGSVARLAPDALPVLRSVSSHGLGVADGLALAEALGRRPRRLALVGIEAVGSEGDALSPEVRGALDVAAVLVRSLVDELLADAASGRD
jgi:hydrogenase maturation protease